jgi:hypothetical protein
MFEQGNYYMNKNIIFSALILLCSSYEYGASLSPQPLVVLTPQLAASAVATCSFAQMPQEALTRIYCLPSKSEQEAVCFPHASWRDRYASVEKTGVSLFSVMNFIFRAPYTPTASCHSVKSRPITLALDCVATTDSQESEKLCFSHSLYCSLPRPESADVAHCFEHQRALAQYNIEKSLQERSDWDHFLSLYSKHLTSCQDDLGARICPLEGEGLDTYINRVLSNAKEASVGVVDASHVQITDSSLFWQLPWTVQRYLLAIAVELDQVDVNKPLPLSKLTLLDHAAQNEDEDFIFWLWNRGAREVAHRGTLGYIAFDVMLKTSDERSLEVLKTMVDEKIKFGWNWSSADDWAADLTPELAMRKVEVMQWGHYCIARRSVQNIRGETPGAKAVKEWALARADLLNCANCEIL